MIRNTVAEYRVASSGSLAFDLLEHQATIETLLAYHTTISSALARCPSIELSQLFNDTVKRLATTFATMEHILDAHEYASGHTGHDTFTAWRVAIERLKQRHDIEQPTTHSARTLPTPTRRIRFAA